MPLILNEEQTMLRDSARSFLAEQAPVSALRQLRDAGDDTGFSRPLWQRFAEMGFSGVLVPEAHGGLGLGHVEAGVLMQQIGHQLSASPFLASSVVAVTALRHGGSAAQQAAWLPRLAAAACIATLAVDEGPKHAPQGFATRATKVDGGWRLHGRKTFVVDGHVADLWLVASDAGLLLVPRGSAGVGVERVAMVDSRPTAHLVFDGTVVGDDARLDGAALDIALDAGRAAAAAELLGIADEVFERTVGYLKERKQFGHAIGEFQALQHRAAALYVDIELARAAVAKAASALDAGAGDAAAAVAVAKARAGASATLAVQEGVQMHGGMGMTDAFDIGFFMKRARVLQEYLGDANFHADRLARQRGY